MELLPVFERGQRVLAAVSGGSDSVALLLLLNDMRQAGEIELCAAHLNHGIRGTEADGDERFVRELCEKLGVNAYFEHIDVPRLAGETSVGLETAARNARWEFLFRAKECMNCDVIAAAHHMDDQAETVLMHILRGGGLRGAMGMREKHNGVVRPLLGISKKELTDFLASRGQDYRQDSTNARSDNPRNLLRNEVMPLISSFYPAAPRALCRFADIAGADDNFMRKATDEWLEENAFVTPYGYVMSMQGDTAILRRATRELTDADFEGVTRVIEGAGAGRPTQIPNWRVEYAGSRIFFVSEGGPPRAEAVALEDGARLMGIGRMRATYGVSPVPSRDPWEQTLDAEALEGAVIRTRRAGDSMRPLGTGGTKKLKDIFIDARMPRAHRDFAPLVARGSDILWIPGMCVAESVKLTSDTIRAVRLKWEREDMLPWKRKC